MTSTQHTKTIVTSAYLPLKIPFPWVIGWVFIGFSVGFATLVPMDKLDEN